MSKPLTCAQQEAKVLLDEWTYTNGNLLHGSAPDNDEVVYDESSLTIYLHGMFTAETLIELAMHMKSTQE